jgi:hypothetical protein
VDLKQGLFRCANLGLEDSHRRFLTQEVYREDHLRHPPSSSVYSISAQSILENKETATIS